MSKRDRGEKRFFDTEMLLKKDHETLLAELKERAFNVPIADRVAFETNLLQLAQEIKDENKRNAVYEVLVSLQTIWNQHQPEKGLQEKFRAAFAGGNNKEAEAIYRRLAKQGLDYIDTFQIGEGYLITLFTAEKGMLLHYNKKEFTFYTPECKQLAKVLVPEHLEILDVTVPYMDRLKRDTADSDNKKPGRKLWLLMANRVGRKIIVSVNIESIDAIEMIPHHLEQGGTYLGQNLGSVTRLAYFRDHLLLISDHAIYYQKEDKKWNVWYTTQDNITAIATTEEGTWIGQRNGDALMLRDISYVGNRKILPGFSQPIKNIRIMERHVLVWSNIHLIIADNSGNQDSKPIETNCEIKQAVILEENLLLLTANGMMTARDIDQGNIRWQLNLGDLDKILFPYRRYLYCGKTTGEVQLFEIPAFRTMKRDLESRDIHVEKQTPDIAPNAPIRYFFEFIGRSQLLQEIKEKSQAHFLIYGEPRIGKTSLLNVLPNALDKKVRCCTIEISHLLNEAASYEAFERNLMKTCMEQHFIKLPLPEKEGCHYQDLRAMVRKIKGDESFCIFLFDNFFIPDHFDEKSGKNLRTFFRSMLVHLEVRFIMTCSRKHKKDLEEYFGDFKDVLKQRHLLSRELSLFYEGEVKNTIREKISAQQAIVNEIYRYIGRFPHLIHFFEPFQPENQTIEEYTKKIANSFSENIFEYFRDLSRDARLLMATCLYEKLVGEKVSYETFYDKFPFLKKILLKERLDETLVEINNYGSGLAAYQETESFRISISDHARLFYHAAQHLPWIKDLEIFYKFSSSPNSDKAQQVAYTFARISKSELDNNEILKKITEKNQGKFYVSRLTDQGLKSLKMPLTTFIIIPIKPWQKEDHKETFHNLYIDFQEFNRKVGEAPIFYTLLFDLHGVVRETIKADIEGFERISIIDPGMIKHILMAESPQETASPYIFEQLSIKERSPYTTAGAVPDSLFYGRDMEIALIRGLPENIGVFGTRTIGKTSLLRKLYNTLQSHHHWLVFDIDCARIESEKTLLQNLAEKMEISFVEISDMDRFRQYVTREAEKSGRCYLFLLDEVDRLVEYDMQHDERIFNTFNRLCTEALKNGGTAARFILFGFKQMFEQMKNPTSRLYNFMVFLPLQPLDRESAMGLVTRPIESILVRWYNLKDAEYLVDCCSRHPRLLQAACHALLNNLDDKEKGRNEILRSDVDRALNSQRFREICMRLYPSEEKPEGNNFGFKNADKKKRFFLRRALDKEVNIKEEFLSDIHRITILAAIRLLFEEKKETFTIMDIQKELKRNSVDISPDNMRNILDRLCLSGNFRLREESVIIAKEEAKLRIETGQSDDFKTAASREAVRIVRPDDYGSKTKVIPEFDYEFGVKIFPQLLVAHFGGLEQCKREQQKMMEKGAWREWLGRH